MTLVERLRYWQGDGHPHGLLHGEAADRIEELEAALNNAGAYLETRVGDWPERVLRQVRETLGVSISQ